MTRPEHHQQIPESKTSRLVALLIILTLALTSCGDGTEDTTTTEEQGTSDQVQLRYEFENGSDGWASDVSDYSEATRPEDILSETGVLPPGIEDDSGYFHLAATNRSDDMFLYMARLIGEEADLLPSTAYTVDFTVAAASNAPSNCAGIGGAPGESVWLKVGASTDQPLPIQENGDTRLSVDKGNQSQGGEAAAVAGVIANGIPCEEALESDQPYAMVTWEKTLDDPVTTNEEGEMWLFVGIDSGFEGRTSLYYDSVEVVLTPQE